MSVRLNMYVLFTAAAYLMPAPCGAADKFYAIGHMTDDITTADWAINAGANAVEMDMNFDVASGMPTNIYHGSPCDCSCHFLAFLAAGSICEFDDPCARSSTVEALLTHISTVQSLALVYIDSKTGNLPVGVQEMAGREVVNTLETQLFANGYMGKVLIGSGGEREYIRTAASRSTQSPYSSRFYFTFDDLGVVPNLQFLKSLPVSNLIYNTGLSACSPTQYYTQTILGGINRGQGVISNVFVWTLDKTSSFDTYYNYGARGILTNKVPSLIEWAESKGLQLATPGDDSLQPATNTNIVEDPGSCDCDYYSGGCTVSEPAPDLSACECSYVFLWSCNGRVVPCQDLNSALCQHPDNSRSSCIQGGGDCGGY